MRDGERFQDITLEEAIKNLDLNPLPDGIFGIPHFLLRVFGENIEVTDRRDGTVTTTPFFEFFYENQKYRFSAQQGQLVIQILLQPMKFKPLE